jgi:hypothetical protein
VAKVNGYTIVEKDGSWFVLNADDEVVGGPYGSYEQAEEAALDLPQCPPKKDPSGPGAPPVKPRKPGGGNTYGM